MQGSIALRMHWESFQLDISGESSHETLSHCSIKWFLNPVRLPQQTSHHSKTTLHLMMPGYFTALQWSGRGKRLLYRGHPESGNQHSCANLPA
jgi:hypothetical protein